MSKRKKLHSTEKPVRTAVLVAVITKKQPPEKAREYLDELEFLATTLGLKTIKKFFQRLDQPDTRYFVGKGKFEEIKEHVQASNADVLIFDDDLSPSQVRNIEKEMKVQIYDRSLLILDIFLARAQTAQAKTQVELARSQYLLPRLTRMWSHLERQRGGTGTRGGAGEKELETDRRMIRDKISLLKKKLEKIDQQNRIQRGSRGGLVRVALVGYTNVGKSTIMNQMTKSNVFAENKLFATVDSTVRKVVLNNVPFLLSDTVGFIRKLPHNLIECFKSTLDEIREADLVLHVVDISHPSFEEHIEVVNQTMDEIGCGDKNQILVFNKIDAYEKEAEHPLEIPELDEDLGNIEETLSSNSESDWDSDESNETNIDSESDSDSENGKIDFDEGFSLQIDHNVDNEIGNYGNKSKSEDNFESERSGGPYTLEELENMYLAKGNDAVVFISAQHKTNFDTLRELVTTHVSKEHFKRYPNYLG